MNAYVAKTLPLSTKDIDSSVYSDALIDAFAQLEVYKAKLDGSKLNRMWFLPTLQKKEALASSQLEGTQATFDGVLENQVVPNENDKGLVEVQNYLIAAEKGYHFLQREKISIGFIKDIHRILMGGKTRKSKKTIPGEFRTEQNYIGKPSSGNSISFIPPVAESVNDLMENLIEYMSVANDNLRHLVRIAIIHAQFETIHPFMDGNGRVGRILIPLYLYSQDQIPLPCFFISEALERDKFKYYALLNETRKNNWNDWILFFLETVTAQSIKYIHIIDKINELYERDLRKANDVIRSKVTVDIINLLYEYPVITSKKLVEKLHIPVASAARYLTCLTDAKILFADEKSRNRNYYYYELINLVRG